jgi:hypothetical protein
MSKLNISLQMALDMMVVEALRSTWLNPFPSKSIVSSSIIQFSQERMAEEIFHENLIKLYSFRLSELIFTVSSDRCQVEDKSHRLTG